MFNIIMCQDFCELICFKLGVMLNTTKLNSLNDIAVQASRVMEMVELVQSMCCEVAWSTSNVHDG